MHRALTRIRQALQGTAYAGRLYLVGGAVRDELLGREVTDDLDIVVEGDAHEAARLLHERGAAAKPPQIFPRFGTAMVQVESTDVELATARKESYSQDSRKPEVEPASLKEDALRRDFTCNALLRSLETGELVDPIGQGLEDLRNKVLRTPLDPAATFYDDPLRMLRAVRFRWKLGFDPAPGLYEAVRQEASRLEIISGERIRDEFLKMLCHPQGHRALQDLMDLDLLAQFAPELTEMVGLEQGGYHHKDVWEHTLLVVQATNPKDPLLRLSALLHDVGKPRTRSVESDGRTRFFEHDTLGAEMTEEILNRLRFSSGFIARVVRLVRKHMRLVHTYEMSPSLARRLVREFDDDLFRFVELVEADVAGLKPGTDVIDFEQVRRTFVEVLSKTPSERLVSPLDGKEIMEITGLKEGKEIGRLKRLLDNEVLEGRLKPGDKAAARELVEREMTD
jgi:poly(A) polymerase